MEALNDYELDGSGFPGSSNLHIGAPGPKQLRTIFDLLQSASTRLQQRHRVEESLQYGCVTGGRQVRAEIASFLSRQYGENVEKEDVFVTSGATSGLRVLMTHFFGNRRVIFFEDPTYPVFAGNVGRDRLMVPSPVKMEGDGMNLDELEDKCAQLSDCEVSEQFPFRAAVFLVTVHQNPTGVCYSPEKCRRLIKLARKFDLLLICDDVYNMLTYASSGKDSKPWQRLFQYDDKSDGDYKGNVVSNGSFSKVMAPGLRMGWYEAPQRVMESLKRSYLYESNSGNCYFLSHIVAEALKSGEIDKHLQTMRVDYGRRMAAAVKVVEERLSEYGVSISHPSGGYFLWVTLPEHINAADVLEISAKDDVTFVKGGNTSVVGRFKNCMRLSIAFYEMGELVRGVERLCDFVEKVARYV